MRLRDTILQLTARRVALALLAGAAGALASAAPAVASGPAPCTINWTGAAGDGLWSDAGNWDTGTVPASSDIVCVNVGADATGVTQDVTIPNSVSVQGLEVGDTELASASSSSLAIAGNLNLESVAGRPDVLGSGLTLIAQGTTTVDPGLDVCLASGDTLTNSGSLALGDGADLGGNQRTDCGSTSGGAVTNTGTITAASTSAQETIDSLTSATGSTLDGPGTLKVGSSLTLPSGSGGLVGLGDQLTLEDSAATTVGANVQVCTAPGTLLTFEPRSAVALGEQSDLGANDIAGCDGATGGGQIVDEAPITTSGAGGTVTIDPALFDNGDSVTVNGADTLAIPASSTANGDTGTYTIEPQATLAFSGTERDIDYAGSSGTTFGGGGTLEVTGGLTDFQTDADLGGLHAFTVTAGATAEVDDTLESPAAGASPSTALSGVLGGYGNVTVSPGSSLSLIGTQAEIGEDVWLTNEGTLSVASGAKACIDADAVLENGATGTLTLGSGAALGQNPADPNCGGGTLENDASGAISSVGGATINTGLFDNAGTVTVPAGTLVLDASNQDTDTGSYSIGSSATLSIQGGATRVLDGTMSGAGRLQLSASGGSGTSLELSPGATASVGSLSVASRTTLQIDGGSSTPLASSSSPAPVSVSGTAALAGTLAFNGDALSAPTTSETLALLSCGSCTGTPSFPADDNGWAASLGTIAGAPGIVTTITPPPPQSITAPQINGTAAQDATLTVTEGSWSGSPTQISDQWQDCDPTSLVCTDIPGATGSSYTLTANDVGEQIQVVETATGAGGSTTQESDMTDVVASLAPVNISPPGIDGDQGMVGEVLTEIPGEWQNSPSVSLQWEDCDITGTVCTAIPGATGPTYTTTENDVNASIVVVETATNAYGSSQAASEPSEPLMDFGTGGDGAGGVGGSGTGNGGGHRQGTATVSVPAHTVSGADLSIALRCPQQASCPVTLTLTATEPASAAHGRRAHARRRRSRIVVVGSETVRIAAGERQTVTVSLNRTGTRLLDRTHTLRAVLTASSRRNTLTTTSVTFTAAAHDTTRRSHRHRAHRTHRAAGHRAEKRTHHRGRRPAHR